jgi:hypothetical protein
MKRKRQVLANTDSDCYPGDRNLRRSYESPSPADEDTDNLRPSNDSERASWDRRLCAEHTTSGRGCWSRAFRDEVHCFTPTSQTVKFLVLLIGESISVLRYEVGSDFLWTAPWGGTEGTLGLLLMLVPRVPS